MIHHPRLPLVPSLAVLALLLVLPPAAVQAALEFENSLVEVEAPTGSKEVKVAFPFRNTGSGTERIKNIDTSCGCLSAKSSQRVVRPGESGQIDAVFSVRGLTGVIEKSINVVIGSSVRSPITLTVRVHIPLLIEIEPKMTHWEMGAPAEPKRIRVTMRGEEPIRIVEIDSSRRNVAVTLHTVEEGRVYEIELLPIDTNDVMLGVVRIDTDTKMEGQSRQMAFFRIDRDEDS